MHICFLTNEYPKSSESHGGIGTFVKFLAENLVSKGIKVSIIGIYNIKETTSVNNVNVYRLKKSLWKFAKFYQHNKRIQNKINIINNETPIDIVEGSELNFAFFDKKTSYKKLIRLHGGHHFFAFEEGKKTSFWRSFQEKRSFKKANYFVAVSDYVGKKTIEYLGFNFNYITIYNNIKLDSFYESNFLKEEPNKLLFIGTVCEKKGVKNLILAFHLLKETHPNVTLDIVGRDWKTKEGKSYTSYLKTLINPDYKESIKFIGNVAYRDLPIIIEKAQVCVYPSLTESFGLTLLEAMAMGKLIAASNIKPFKEIVGESNAITFFKSNSIKDISKKISILLSNNLIREDLRKKSREHVIKTFKQESILKQNIKFYKSIIK